jgi:membrane-associated protease RseP (regulator of RpoE activity)
MPRADALTARPPCPSRWTVWTLCAALGCASGGGPGIGNRGGSWPGGIGAVLRHRPRDGRLVLSSVPEEGGAARAGLREGDAVVAIDGHPVASMASDDVGRLLRGEVGTRVTLRIRRDGAERDVAVERGPYRRAGR